MLVFGAAEVRFSRSPKLPTLDTALTWATAAAFMQLPRFDFRRVWRDTFASFVVAVHGMAG